MASKRQDIYEKANPCWYADTFIFKKDEKLGTTVWVKVNSKNKIEEIGIDIEHRTPCRDLQDLISKSEPATQLHRNIINRIGDEFFGMIKQRQELEKR